MKSIILVSIFFLILMFPLSAYAQSPADIEFKIVDEWHSMHVDSQPIHLQLTLKNNLNRTNTFYFVANFQSLDDEKLSNNIKMPITLPANKQDTVIPDITLASGSYKIDVSLNDRDYQCCFVWGGSRLLSVQPYQVYLNFVLSITASIIAAISSSAGTITAIILIKDYRKKSKVDSANILSSIESTVQRNHLQTIVKLNKSLAGEKSTLTIRDMGLLFDLLEGLSFHVKEGVISKKSAYELFYELFKQVFTESACVEYLKHIRDDDKFAWRYMIWLNEEFEKMKKSDDDANL